LAKIVAVAAFVVVATVITVVIFVVAGF